MEFMVIFFLVALAMGNAENDCSDERAEACIEDLLAAVIRDTTEEEVCRELSTSIDCLTEAANECLEEDDEEVREGLEQLENTLKEHCGGVVEEEEDDVMKKCFKDNEDYIYECIYEGSTQAMALLLEGNDKVDEKALQCSMYSLMADCFVERIDEKCGEEAAKLAKAELDDLPEEIAEACGSTTTIQHDFQLLDLIRK